MKKGGGAGNLKKSLKKPVKQSSRREEMHELFQSDMSDRKQARGFTKGTGNSLKKKHKSSFKSQSRYAVVFVSLPLGIDPSFVKLNFLNELSTTIIMI